MWPCLSLCADPEMKTEYRPNPNPAVCSVSRSDNESSDAVYGAVVH
jgi:hypothetical protein